MEVFTGTSGWYYEWNEEKNLAWYVKNSGLNAVELNASFYRFPFKTQIKSWQKIGAGLRWAIKVHRLVTHLKRFNEDAFKIWKKFKELFKPLDDFIDFFLFQIPSSFTDLEKILKFAQKTKLGQRFALEIRNKKILEDEKILIKIQNDLTLVSIDSPDFQNKIFSGEIIYLRMHGRTSWYQHNYSLEELSKIAEKINEIKPKKVYVFFNNNHNMLANAKMMFQKLKIV